MNFLTSALEALPTAAAHPFAFVAYLVVVLCWSALAWKARRNKQLLAKLDILPKKDRLEALRVEMGAVEVKEGLTSEQWIRNRQHTYLLGAFMALCLMFVVVFAIAVTQASKIDESRDELISILEIREDGFLFAVDNLLESSGGSSEPIHAETEKSSMQAERKVLIEIRSQVATLSSRRIEALRNGELALFHELGNEIDRVTLMLFPLIASAENSVSIYAELAEAAGGLMPGGSGIALVLMDNEAQRVTDLNALVRQAKDLTSIEL